MMGLKLVEVGPGIALVELKLSENTKNIFGATHGAAVFSLIDGAFEVAANSHGTVAVALNVNVSYINPSTPGEVKNDKGDLIATCQAMAYRKKDPLPFL